MSTIKVNSVETTDDTKDMRFSTNSTEAMRIDVDGNVTTTASVTTRTINLGNAPATLEHFVSEFSQVSNNYTTLHTFTAPAAGHYLFTISASLGNGVSAKIELSDGTKTLLEANWGYTVATYNLYRTGLITLDGSTNVLFRAARSDDGGSIALRGVQAYGVRLG
jgi:hypothetical protein